MTRLSFLVPREEMATQVREVVRKLNINNVEVKAITTNDAVSQAQESIENGAQVIIARGYQSSLIKQIANCTVIDIAMTGQEMGVMVAKAKDILNKQHPIIAVVGFENMFCDMQSFNSLYDVDLRTFYVCSQGEIEGAVDTAFAQNADIVMGGDIVNQYADQKGIKHMFTATMGEESIRIALRTAQNVGYALDLEKQNTAQLKTLLDYSFNAIVKLNKEGNVDALNSIAEEMLKIDSAHAVGRPIIELISQLDKNLIIEALQTGKEQYASYITINNVAYAFNLAPIQLGDYLDGAVISFSEVEKIVEMEAIFRKDICLNKLMARHHFEFIEKKSVQLLKEIKLAKLYAMTNAPILIVGDMGCEKEFLAQCIHNYSPQKQGPFVSVKCSALSLDKQYDFLFGKMDSDGKTVEKGAVNIASGGTLVLSDVECLSQQCQANLALLFQENAVVQNPTGNILPVNMRIITTTCQNLMVLGKEGVFNLELFYVLNTLSISIPSFNNRKEDIERWVEHYINIFSKKYLKYIVVTKDAKKYIANHNWEGNLVQIKSFCERVVVATSRRTVNEDIVQKLLVDAYPVICNRMGDNKIVAYKNQEAAQLAALLEQCSGNRTDVASKLGISTTTLWRKIKKYNIESKYQ